MNAPPRLAPLRLVVVFTTLFFFLTISGLTIAVSANAPAWYFTDNIGATSPSDEITLMEQALLDRIHAATTSIDVAIYDFNRDRLRDALLAAHDRQVAVRVVADDAARNHSVYQLYYDALANAGIPVVDDQRPGSIMHNKFFIFDSEVVWTGSANMTDNDFTVNHNNSLVLTSTLLAEIYGLEFGQMFAGNFSVAKSGSLTTSLEYNGRPLEIYFSPKDNAVDQIIAQVAAAEESVHFSIFFFTHADLAQALVERHQAGVEIRGVWDLLGAASPYSQDETLCAVGIPIKIETFYGKMHNKFMVIDAHGASPRVVTGSMNWSGAGNNGNDENSLIIHDPLVAQAYYVAFYELYDALPLDTLCAGVAYYVWLPLIVNPPTPSPTPEPIVGDNVVCQQIDQAEICAWVSNGAPPRYSTVTVYGRLRIDGQGQTDATMYTTWNFRTTASYCQGTTDAAGVASCSRAIGGATAGYQVNIDVEIGGYQATTWFTPH